MSNDDVREHLPLAPRDFLILFSLVGGRLHGYRILRNIDEESGGDVRMDPANLYRALRRLAADGLVEETDGADAGRRRCYALSPIGQRVVSAEAARIDRLASAARDKKLIPAAE